ncbi:MAG: hypothetical protein R3Y21_01560 [Mycoplasmatota bacterium]
MNNIMQDNLNLYINFFITFAAIMFFSSLFFNIFMDKIKIDKKRKIYGLLMNLKLKPTLLLSCIILYQIFIISAVLFIKDFQFEYCYPFIIICILYSIVKLDIASFLFNLLNNSLMFMSLYGANLLIRYSIEIKSFWYIEMIAYILLIFVIFHSIFISLLNCRNLKVVNY